MVFTRFVEVGRVAVITYGPDVGKYVVIVDIIDQARALVDGPTSGVKRQPVPFRRLQLTDYKVTLPRTAGSTVVKKVLEKEKFAEQWAKSAWSKKQALRSKRASMTDFDRYKLRMAKKQRSMIVKEEVAKLK